MKDFSYYLNKVGQVGEVKQVFHSLVYVKGLPSVRPTEMVMFESGEVGQVMSLTEEYAEVLLLSKIKAVVGMRVARTNKLLRIKSGEELLGKTIGALGIGGMGFLEDDDGGGYRLVDVEPHGIVGREIITAPFKTGVTLVDLVVPLGKGQRELVIGDRKTGKTLFLLQTVMAQAKLGTVCIYAAIGKRKLDIRRVSEFLKSKGVESQTVVVASSSSDPPGVIFLTPYSAMTIAEHFRDMGRDVLVVLDDLTTHAKYYRELSLTASRFPGRDSYPGDIFYVHARLLERAGKFVISKRDDSGGKNDSVNVSITCLPVAESVAGDMSGYIQTNLMATTDGHIYFDGDLFDQGRRPAVNPFLSVTRVGRQVQSPILKELSRRLIGFLVRHERMREFLHFGAELNEDVRRTLALGDRIIEFFNQAYGVVNPVRINMVILACLWAGYWKDEKMEIMKQEMEDIVTAYGKDEKYKQGVEKLLTDVNNFDDLVKITKDQTKFILSVAK